jgi:hypothetical protein
MDQALRDLVTFARIEVAAADIEPWAAVIAATRAPGPAGDEAALWAVKLYNAYDDLGSAWRVIGQWPGPREWAAADTSAANTYPCSRERRSLRGGRLTRHIDSYVELLGPETQMGWLREAIPHTDPATNFAALMPYLRRVWGVGRQTAFEWAEFGAKVLGLPVETPDAYLWESTGPRQSIERLYADGAPAPSVEWLNARARECRAMLAGEGVELSWWDFETVICDFNVMRKGRYYPGQHLAMIREEIEGLPDRYRQPLSTAFRSVVPEPWCDVAPGVDKPLARAYRDTGRIRYPSIVEEQWSLAS